MSGKASSKRPSETWREWCAPENRVKYVTRGELIVWIDRVVGDLREEMAPWYVKLWRRATTRKPKPKPDIAPKGTP